MYRNKVLQLLQRLATGWTTKGSELQSQQGKEFSLFHILQTGSGVHSTSYLMGTRDSSLGVKRQWREANHTPLTNADVKKK
jgi:hypothetical protein